MTFNKYLNLGVPKTFGLIVIELKNKISMILSDVKVYRTVFYYKQYS